MPRLTGKGFLTFEYVRSQTTYPHRRGLIQQHLDIDMFVKETNSLELLHSLCCAIGLGVGCLLYGEHCDCEDEARSEKERVEIQLFVTI